MLGMDETMRDDESRAAGDDSGDGTIESTIAAVLRRRLVKHDHRRVGEQDTRQGHLLNASLIEIDLGNICKTARGVRALSRPVRPDGLERSDQVECPWRQASRAADCRRRNR